jgi:hypothetical protein
MLKGYLGWEIECLCYVYCEVNFGNNDNNRVSILKNIFQFIFDSFNNTFFEVSMNYLGFQLNCVCEVNISIL